MIERSISVKEVEEGIRRGAKELQAPNKILHHHTYFTVVTKRIGDNTYVTTVKPRW